ncbi:DUF948 domain-containing protein [Neobacillus mesonae]|uniref:DUF948 domain-containing protein n=1 Tax=Neobacillus mesonae TaxID=1193713 RepID=A0A3Q9QX71_9BACI|nr:DUF948 domain-containing protein [Neobacillus mesonae]AZU63636.1 DUF948 domain-containing protein [Neobacillus mesonae]MED4203040.1 DUF948 domain-containing protein [Neobacillus mesonae]
MQIILYLSVALIAVAFLVLVIFISKTLKTLQGTLDSVSDTLKGVEKQLDGVTRETTLLLQKTNTLAEDLQQKSANLNSVVDAVKGVGVTVSNFNGTLQNITKTVDIQVEESKEKVSQIIQWSNVILELKDKWQERKEAKKEASLQVKQKVRSY